MNFIVFLAIILLVGCDAGENKLTSQIKINTAMKSHCIGRSLIDLPEDYVLKAGVAATFTPDQHEVEDGNIDLVVMPNVNITGFQQKLAARRAELTDDAGMTSKLSLIRDLPSSGKLFRVHIIEDAYRSEVHWMLDGTYMIASIKSFKNQVELAETMLLDFVKSVELADRRESSSASFCLAGAVVKGKYRDEFASFHFAPINSSEISFSADVSTYEKDDSETLHQRLGGPNSLMQKFNIKESILRKSEKSIAGMRAEEWVSSIRPGEKGSDRDLSFLLETMRSTPSPAAPKIHLEMDLTGHAARDEVTSLALWDKITRTIRLRVEGRADFFQ
jgi:hypothetical protein